jgi:hypothetical protein
MLSWCLGPGQEYNLGSDELSTSAGSTKRDTLCHVQNNWTRLIRLFLTRMNELSRWFDWDRDHELHRTKILTEIATECPHPNVRGRASCFGLWLVQRLWHGESKEECQCRQCLNAETSAIRWHLTLKTF